jgi:hypothetical protein
MPRLKDGTHVEDPRLDRLVEFDEQSRQYAATDILRSTAQPKNKSYRVGKWLDQRSDGACVGFSFLQEALAMPRRARGLFSKSDLELERKAREIYWSAQRIDPWPGGSYPGASPRYEGTSMLAGVKIMQKLGFYDEYRWAFGEQDLALSVSNLGPAVIGVNWYEGMYEPNSKGFIEPTGRNVGGHAILVMAVNVTTLNAYRVWNSWGRSWGRNGWAYLSRQHMAQLLSQNGEACIPVKRNQIRG